MAKKRKSLMDALGEYQEKNEFGRAQRKEEREKKMAKKASKTKSNTKTAFSTKQFLKTDKVKEGATHRRPPTAPPPVPRGGGSGSGSGGSGSGSGGNRSNSGDTGYSGKKGEARQQANVTRENRNKSTEDGGIRNTGGRGTTPKATSGKPKRSEFGTGRTGAAAYNRAIAAWNKKNSTSTPSSPAGQRPGRRGQGGRK